MSQPQELKEIKKKENDNWPSGWFFSQWLSLMGAILTCAVFLFHQNQVQSARTDLLTQQLNETIQRQAERSDRILESFQMSISRQSARSDHLYDLLKEKIK